MKKMKPKKKYIDTNIFSFFQAEIMYKTYRIDVTMDKRMRKVMKMNLFLQKNLQYFEKVSIAPLIH